MPTSVNKGYQLQVTGTNPNTWGDVLNEDALEVIDANLGGSVTKSLTNVNVELDETESQALRVILNGGLTGNVQVSTLAVGMTIVENNCTGSFAVTFVHASGGTPITIPNGTVALVATAAGGASPKQVSREFPTGTRMGFQQTTPPAGWSKDTATSGLNNSAMRLVTGSVVNGGTDDFTTIFGSSRTLSGSVGNTTLTANQIPAHRHLMWADDTGSGGDFPNASNQSKKSGRIGGSSSFDYGIGNSAVDATLGRTSSIGNSESHTHSLSLSNLNMGVRYFDFTIGVRL